MDINTVAASVKPEDTMTAHILSTINRNITMLDLSSAFKFGLESSLAHMNVSPYEFRLVADNRKVIDTLLNKKRKVLAVSTIAKIMECDNLGLLIYDRVNGLLFVIESHLVRLFEYLNDKEN